MNLRDADRSVPKVLPDNIFPIFMILKDIREALILIAEILAERRPPK